MLEQFPELRTRNIEAVKSSLRVRGRDGRFDLPAGRIRAEYVLNSVRNPDLSLSCIRHNAPITISFEPSDDVLIGYQLRRTSQVILDGKTYDNHRSLTGRLVPGGSHWTVRNPDGFEVLTLGLPAAALSRKLTAYLGLPEDMPDLLQPADAEPRRAERLRDLVIATAKRLDEAGDDGAAGLQGDAVDEIYLALFEALSTLVLEQEPKAPSGVQVGRVEQYLVAHFDTPVTVEQLAMISGVAGRSVMLYFQARYGCSPQAYRKRVQIEMAHSRLSSCSDRTSMALVASQCGFASLTHFETAYRDHFGHPRVPSLRPPRRRW